MNFCISKLTSNRLVIKKVLGVKCGKDSRGGEAGHWTERSEGSGWSDSATPNSLFFGWFVSRACRRGANQPKSHPK